MSGLPRSTAPLARTVGRGTFGSDAIGYHAARVGYSDELIDRVYSYCGAAGPRVLEIGPGTGLATEPLLARGAGSLLAIEPDAGMAQFLADRLRDPRLTVKNDGFIEADAGPPHDLVFSACAFHWIDPQPGLAKVRTVLKPGGAVALVWHSYRNPSCDPFFAALAPHLSHIALPPSEGENGYVYLDQAGTFDLLAGAGLVDLEQVVFRTERLLDAEQMQSLYGSFSFVRVLPKQQRERLLALIGDIVADQFGGSAPSVVLSPLYLARNPQG